MLTHVNTIIELFHLFILSQHFCAGFMFFQGNPRGYFVSRCFLRRSMQVTVVVLLAHENEFQGGLNHFEPGFDGGVAWLCLVHFNTVSIVYCLCLKTNPNRHLAVSQENRTARLKRGRAVISPDAAMTWPQSVLGDAVFFYGDQCMHWISPVVSGRRAILQMATWHIQQFVVLCWMDFKVYNYK